MRFWNTLKIENMNNEKYNQIIDEAYKNYENKIKLQNNWEVTLRVMDINTIGQQELLSQEEFINKCKTDSEFSERWGLKIEERELSLEEKEYQLEKTNCINDIENDRIIYGHEWEKYIQEQYEGIQLTQGIKIPTKLITITYNNKTIESYEQSR